MFNSTGSTHLNGVRLDGWRWRSKIKGFTGANSQVWISWCKCRAPEGLGLVPFSTVLYKGFNCTCMWNFINKMGSIRGMIYTLLWNDKKIGYSNRHRVLNWFQQLDSESGTRTIEYWNWCLELSLVFHVWGLTTKFFTNILSNLKLWYISVSNYRKLLTLFDTGCNLYISVLLHTFWSYR